MGLDGTEVTTAVAAGAGVAGAVGVSVTGATVVGLWAGLKTKPASSSMVIEDLRPAVDSAMSFH